MNQEFVKASEICKLLRISESTLTRWVERGEFPKPLVIGNVRRWPSEVVKKALVTA